MGQQSERSVSVIVKDPQDCTEAEISKFAELVQLGGEVKREGFKDLIRSAKSLIWLQIDGKTAGVAGLKHPRKQYRQRVFANAKAEFPSDQYPFELGWVYVDESYRGKKYSRHLIENALKSASGKSVYATSRTDQAAMHRTLKRYEFQKEGKPWTSGRDPEIELLLFVREAKLLFG